MNVNLKTLRQRFLCQSKVTTRNVFQTLTSKLVENINFETPP